MSSDGGHWLVFLVPVIRVKPRVERLRLAGEGVALTNRHVTTLGERINENRG